MNPQPKGAARSQVSPILMMKASMREFARASFGVPSRATPRDATKARRCLPEGTAHDLRILTFDGGEYKKRTDACPFSCPSFMCASRNNLRRVFTADDCSGSAPVSVSSVCSRSHPNAEFHGCSCRYLQTRGLSHRANVLASSCCAAVAFMCSGITTNADCCLRALLSLK